MQSTSEGELIRKLSTSLLISLVWLVCTAAICRGQAVVSNTYENLDTRDSLTNTPVTFSRIGADGHFTKGIAPMIDGRKLPAQVAGASAQAQFASATLRP
jgi:hypothetical protein